MGRFIDGGLEIILDKRFDINGVLINLVVCDYLVEFI